MNTKKYGFELIRSRELAELDATLHEMQHEKSGAKLVWLERPDDNKTFGIAFMTTPEDSTGVFHILEHSVLCGSKRYPVKEPFVELLKNSMNTFLNAMTFSDKTAYPVSSRNDKDFMNLMRVYLDAVFAPAIYDKPEIFCQEGWHYEYDENGNLQYKGVVFNEMKGAYASADRLLVMKLTEKLFPDNCYRFSSGGDPAVIPDLTYERFLDFHKRFYAPSNSVIFLDGDVNIDEVLDVIDGEYLSSFEKAAPVARPAHQAPVNGGVSRITYELAPEEDPAKKYRVAWGNVVGDFDDREKLVAMNVLLRVLCDNNQSPLPKCILEKGLAEDVIADMSDEELQPWAFIEVKNFEENKLEEIEKTIRAELKKLADEGIDREMLIAHMANMEFVLRERDYRTTPKGLIFGITMAQNVFLGADAAMGLEVGDIFDVLKSKIDDGYFENLIRTVFLDNPHTACVIMEPSHTAGEERRLKEQQRLERESSSWSEEKKNAVIELQKRTNEWQNSTDSEEALATLPVLKLSDISAEPEQIPTDVITVGKVPVVRHAIACSGIVYCTLYFDIDDLSEEKLSLASFLCGLLGELPTETYTAEQLQSRRNLFLGKLKFGIASYTKEGRADECARKLSVSFNALEANLEKATELVCDVITSTKFDDNAIVADILKQRRSGMMQAVVMSGHAIALGRVSAQTAVSGVVDEHTGGFCYYQWLKKRDEEQNISSLCSELECLFKSIFTVKRMTLSVTCLDKDIYNTVLGGIASKLPEGNDIVPYKIAPWGKRCEGIVIPADISFAVRGGNISDVGGNFNGTLPLAARIIGLAYLWNVIRVKGGAYGAGLVTRANGVTACYSYRDPNASGSLEAYCGAADFLKGFCGEEADLTGFIIGAVSDESPLLTPSVQAKIADGDYFTGTTYEDRVVRRKELLASDKEQLIKAAEYIGKTVGDGGICVIGGQKKIDECKLDNIITL